MNRILVSLTFIVLILCSGLLVKSNEVFADEKKVFDKVMESGKIRCGYAIYPPSFYVDPNTGNQEGIMAELTEELGKKLNLEIEWTEEVGYGVMSEGLKTGRYDMICSGKWLHSSEAKISSFSYPLFYTNMYAYTKSGDKRFDNNLNILDSSDYSISTLDGSLTEAIADSIFPNAKKLTSPAMAGEPALLMNVFTGKADITFADTAVVGDFISNNPSSIHKVKTDRAVRTFETTFMFRNNDVRFMNMINIAVRELHNEGTVNRLINKYEKVEGSFGRIAIPYR